MRSSPIPGRPLLEIGQFPDDLEEALRQEIQRIKESDPLTGIVLVVSSETAVAYIARDLAMAGVNLANVHIVTLGRLARRLSLASTSTSTSTSTVPDPRPVLPSGGETALIYTAIEEALRGDNPFGDSSEFPGFGRSISRVITDLVQANIFEIKAPVYSALRQKISDRLRAVSRVFHFYRNTFAKHFITEADTFRSDESVASSILSVFNAENLIIFGLYDFNELQYGFIKALIEAMPVTLLIPSTIQNNRPTEGFKFTSKTIDRLTGDFPTASINYHSTSPSFTQSLFDYTQADNTALAPKSQLKVFSAADPATECDLIAGQVAELIFRKQVIPSTIGIVLWRPEVYRELMIDALQRASIPIYDSIGYALSKTASGRALAGLLALSKESIGGRELLDLLQNGALQRPEIEGLGSFVLIEEIVNTCGVVKGGAVVWEKALDRFVAKHGSTDQGGALKLAPSAHQNDLSLAANGLKAFILKLFNQLDQVQAGPLFVDKINQVIKLVEDFIVRSDPKSAIIDQLNDLRILSIVNINRSNRELLQIISSCLDSTTIGRGEALIDGIALLTPMTARNIKLDHIYLPGLTQGGVPIISRETPLLSDEIRWRINKSYSEKEDQPLSLASRRFEEEKLLFGLIVSAAQASITLSYPVRSLGENKAEFPSHFLLEACRVATGTSVVADELNSISFFDDFTLGDYSDGWENRLAQPDEYILKLARHYTPISRSKFLNDIRLVKSSFSQRLFEVESTRGAGGTWTKYDGMPGKDGASAEEAGVAITELEAYAECPFRCWLTKRLNLKVWRDPEISLDIPPDIVGKVIHTIYEKLFNLALTTGRIPLTSEDITWAKNQIPLIMESMRSWIQTECPAPEGVWSVAEKVLIERVEASLPDLIELQTNYVYFQSEQKIEHSAKLSYSDTEERRVLLTGRIDRIDRTNDRLGVHVIDYKSGLAGDPSKIKDGSRLQLPLYLKILLEKNSDLDPSLCKASYFQVGKDGAVKIRSVDGLWLKSNEGSLDAVAVTLVSGLKSGWFPPLPNKPENCWNCSVIEYCDVRSRNSADYRIDDERVRPLLNLRGTT